MKNYQKTFMTFWVCWAFTLSASTFGSGQEYKTYSNHEKGFSLSIPSDWKILENYMGLSVVAVKLPSDAGDKSFHQNINVAFEPLDPSLDSNGYLQGSLPMLKKLLNHFTVVITGDVAPAAGRPQGKYLIYTHAEDPSLEVIVYFFAVKGRGFTMTCTHTAEKFREVYPLFWALGQSFKVLNLKTTGLNKSQNI